MHVRALSLSLSLVLFISLRGPPCNTLHGCVPCEGHIARVEFCCARCATARCPPPWIWLIDMVSLALCAAMSSRLVIIVLSIPSVHEARWRNGSAQDFESWGCGFESRPGCFLFSFFSVSHHIHCFLPRVSCSRCIFDQGLLLYYNSYLYRKAPSDTWSPPRRNAQSGKSEDASQKTVFHPCIMLH